MDGSAYGKMFDGWITAFLILACLVPLGLWKLVEIVIWLYRYLCVVAQ
jgi:uncharacterized membrane protein